MEFKGGKETGATSPSDLFAQLTGSPTKESQADDTNAQKGYDPFSMMGWAFSGAKAEEPEEQEEEENDLEEDEEEGEGINLDEVELSRKPEQYSREMYEELEHRVQAFQSLLQSHDQEVQTLGQKLKQAEKEKEKLGEQIKSTEEKSQELQATHADQLKNKLSEFEQQLDSMRHEHDSRLNSV